MRHIASALLLAAMLVPAAAAEWYEGKEECPPDMFCTMSVDVEDDVDLQQDEAGPEAQSDIVEDSRKGASGFHVLAAIGALGLIILARRS